MYRIGDPVFVGQRYGYIQRWGIERGVNRQGLHPVKPTSRKQAMNSSLPMVEVWFPKADVYEWWPLDATTGAPLNYREG